MQSSYTPEQIEDTVKEVLGRYKDDLSSKRYAFDFSVLKNEVFEKIPRADERHVAREIDMRVLLLLGLPTTGENMTGFSAPMSINESGSSNNNEKGKQKVHKGSKNLQAAEKKPPQKAVAKNAPEISPANGGLAGKKELVIKYKTPAEAFIENGGREMFTHVSFHEVGENFTTDGYVQTENTTKLLAEHKAAVGGRPVTRFPPEPNGILHIGHAKAININFGFAQAKCGICYLRLDDTNPEKEEVRFVDEVIDMVKWLGYEPYKVTHSSDHFDQLYTWAIVLIQKGLAYVCHQRVEEIRGFDPPPSPWRDRPIEESIRCFEAMKDGAFDEGQATLRLKLTMEDSKQDPVAYRIKYSAHHRSGNKWCIYPTYDYTHCLCDSLENISHSLCTKEFQARRSSYYWLCNALDVYCPVQWEYSRLNVFYTVVSKRKILKLIETAVVSDWDDPRLFTLTALRRRGIPPEVVNKFVAQLGLTVAQSAIDPAMLDAVCRDYLNVTAPRTMAVLEPLCVRIINFVELGFTPEYSLKIPHFPSDPNCKEEWEIAFDECVWLEQSDFREEAEKSYRRLTRSQSVGLRHINLALHFVEAVHGSNGELNAIHVRAEPITKENKPKAFVHWVARPVRCEVRLYERLFLHKNPEDAEVVPGGFLSDLNPQSLTVLTKCVIDRSIATFSKPFDRYQFERTGFFCVDKESNSKFQVFNRTVSLKEDSGKN